MLTAIPNVRVEHDVFALKGGLDLHTPHLAFPPGAAREAVNFEVSTNGGYNRIAGYERYDGRPSPSAASYGILAVSSVAGLAVGDAINGQTSGATGVVAAVEPGLIAYTKATGAFLDGENVREGTTVVGAITAAGGTIDAVALARYRLAAADIYRADILPVSGSGPVRGVFEFNRTLYALRNNAAGTAAVLWRASAGGWTAVTPPWEVGFTGGSGSPPAEGATISQGGVSAVVRRVVVQSGSFAAGNAIGRFVIDAPTGGAFAPGSPFSSGVTANASTASAQIALLPGGRLETAIGNAGGGVRAYGVDGVNRGWEFDGTYLVPIHTGMTSDVPTHVAIHKKHLFFSFGSSVQHAGLGTPHTWTVLAGAAEMGVDGNVTGFVALPSDASTAALAVLTEDSMHVLYGTSSANWNLVALNLGAGAVAHSAQALGQAYVLDDNGIVTIEAVQSYGNFSAPRLTDKIRNFLNQRAALLSGSLANRERQQYRVFFSDGYGLYATIVGTDYRGAMPVWFPNPVFCTCTGTGADGREANFFGSTNGYVYRMDVGTSFDGAPIDYSFALAFAFQRSPRALKTYRALSFELQGEGHFEFNAGYLLGYGDDEINQPLATLPLAAKTTAVFWDQFTWDDFYFDGRVLVPTEFELDGTAENISIIVEGSSALWPSATFNSVAIDYSVRRRVHRV